MIASSVRQWIVKNIVLALILVNVTMFIVVNVASAIGNPMRVINIVALSGDIRQVVARPWTVITYMFTQWNFTHLLVNMLWLWLFGRLWQTIDRTRMLRFFMVYIVSGMAAAVIFEVVNQYMPSYGAGILVGASGSVVGVIVYVALLSPVYPVRMMPLGDIKLWIVAIVSVGMCLLSDLSGNLAGSVAHFGGAIGGFVISLIFRYKDRRCCESKEKLYFGVKQNKTKKLYSSSAVMLTPEQELNEILDKFKHTGYEGLTACEQQRLYELLSEL